VDPLRRAEDCYLYLPFGFADAVNACVKHAVTYMNQVNSVAAFRARFAAGDFDGAFIIAPVRRLLEPVG
jgi:hypothetical protein